MARPNFEAFTVKAKHGILNRIITDVAVCAAFDSTSPPDPLPTQITAKALWDTGATRSVISNAIAKSLGLSAVGTV